MFKKFKKTVSFFTAMLIAVMSLTPLALAAPTYPQGVTKEQVEAAITKTDTAIDSLVKSTQNKSLKDLVLAEIYSDEVLSTLTVGIYSAIEENAESISSAGIKVTASDVAECLEAYPDVQKKLSSCSKWSEVKLDGAIWGIDGKKDFIKAVGCVFAPFNDLLYMLFCDGSYSLNSVIGIKGDFGYENAIVPALKALGCEEITSGDKFYKQAEKDKNTMVENIVSDVITLLEDVLLSPCDKLTDILPSVARFLSEGGLDNAVSKLIEPLRLQIFNISTFIKIEFILSFIQNSEPYTQSFTLNFNDILSSGGLKMTEINLEELASCGTVSGDRVMSDKADTFIVVLRWLIDTVKLNKDSMAEGTVPSEMTEMINTLLAKPTDEIISSLISLLNQSSAKSLEYTWSFAEYTPVAVTYTPNLTAEKYQRVVDGIDDLINEFIAEGGENKTVREALGPKIYSNSLVTELVKGVYGAFENEEMKMLCDLLGIDASTYGVANSLKGSTYSSARYTLYRNAKWSSISSINWGFKDGSKKGFIKAVCDAFSSFEPVLSMLLAEGKITALNAVDLYGSNGYNTAVIPLLEALGCSADSIETYEEFKASASKGKAMESLVTAVVSLIERILDRPVYTITEILPNLLYFTEIGGLETALTNLMYPFTELLSKFGMENIIDMSKLTGEIDIDKMLTETVSQSDMGISLDGFDIKQFMGMGQLVTVQSKRTLNGQSVTVSYIKADQPAIIVTLLRFIARMMKSPGNEDMLTGFMGSGGGNAMFASSGAMAAELNSMTEDETVEWFYKLFFRERAVVEEKVTEKYLPTVIYEPEEKGVNGTIVAVPVIAAVIIAVIFINKKRKKNLYLEEADLSKEDINKTDYQEV